MYVVYLLESGNYVHVFTIVKLLNSRNWQGRFRMIQFITKEFHLELSHYLLVLGTCLISSVCIFFVLAQQSWQQV